jgi:glycosyltransferase involved in cell wall biosynthesis
MIVLTTRRPVHDTDRLEVDGVEVRRVPYSGPDDFLRELNFLTELAAGEIRSGGLVGRACIQPIGTFAFTPKSVLELWRVRLAGIPLLRHFTEVPEPEACPPLRAIRNRFKERVGLSPYSRIFMCSHVMSRAYQALAGISDDRISVIPNGINRTVFHDIPSSEKPGIREQLGLPVEGPIVLCVSSIVPRKGIDLLIEAWKTILPSYPSAKLVIVGSNQVRPTFEPWERMEVQQYQDAVRSSIATLADPSSVILTGEVANVQNYYQAADVFAFTSHKEGLPSAVLEAMSSGLPSVLAPFHGFPEPGEEYGTPGEHFLPATHAPASLAAGILRLLASETERSTMGAAAARWIEETQSMECAADRLAADYRAVCGA